MLLVLASLLIQTFVRLLNVNAGFQADSVLTMEVALPRLAYPGARPAEFFERLIARLSAVPGVEGVAATSSIPLGGHRESASGDHRSAGRGRSRGRKSSPTIG